MTRRLPLLPRSRQNNCEATKVRAGLLTALRLSRATMTAEQALSLLPPGQRSHVAAPAVILEELRVLVDRGLVVAVHSERHVGYRYVGPTHTAGYLVAGEGDRRHDCRRYESCLGAWTSEKNAECPAPCAQYERPQSWEAVAMATASRGRSSLAVYEHMGDHDTDEHDGDERPLGPQERVLAAVVGGLTKPSEIATSVGITCYATSSALSRLAGKGLVRRAARECWVPVNVQCAEVAS